MPSLLLALALFAGLTASPDSLKAEKPDVRLETYPYLTEASEVEAAARALEDYSASDTWSVADWFHRDSFLRRLGAGRALGVIPMNDFRTSLDLPEFWKGFVGDGYFHFIGIRDREGRPAARFRVIDRDEQTLNYHDVLFVRDPKGEPRIADIHIFTTDALVTAILGEVAVSYVHSEFDEGAAILHRFASTRETDPQGAFELFDPTLLNDANRHVFLRLALLTAWAIGEDAVSEVLTAYAEHAPEHEGLPLDLIDWYVVRGDIGLALAEVDRVEALVGYHDPYLDSVRAAVLLSTKRHDEARDYARRASDALPNVSTPLFFEFDLSIEMRDWFRAVELMEQIEANLDFAFDPHLIESHPEYAGFILSPVYQEWRSTRN